jgi:hypothetical protein
VRAIVQYRLFVFFREEVVNQIPSYVDSIKSKRYFSKAHLEKWSVIHLTAWGWYLELHVVPSDEDSLYAEPAQLMDREKAKMQDCMDAERLTISNVIGNLGEISTQEPHDLVMDSRPIPTALSYDLPDLTNDMP